MKKNIPLNVRRLQPPWSLQWHTWKIQSKHNRKTGTPEDAWDPCIKRDHTQAHHGQHHGRLWYTKTPTTQRRRSNGRCMRPMHRAQLHTSAHNNTKGGDINGSKPQESTKRYGTYAIQRIYNRRRRRRPKNNIKTHRWIHSSRRRRRSRHAQTEDTMKTLRHEDWRYKEGEFTGTYHPQMMIYCRFTMENTLIMNKNDLLSYVLNDLHQGETPRVGIWLTRKKDDGFGILMSKFSLTPSDLRRRFGI